MKKFLIWAALSLWMVVTVAWGSFETEDPVDFGLEQLGGGKVSLSDYRGEWVVVNYWATWCAPCRKEIPDLSRLHSERDDVTVLGLAYEELEDEEFFDFLEDFDVTYPILKVDVYSPPEPFGAPKVLPTTIILDQQGRAVKAFLGPVTREDIEQYMETGE
ncbi:MAG: TlpA family protein disulfide reductase [Xanthomonadales bacterium]|nr:TlpA family protein disulfide reductase [Gammaproteobacteria bacterium]NNK52385.1 TlpA family protein disulfide reductase [Xanthomonadales bacterium]